MNVLIIYAHPNPASFNHAALEHLQQGFAKTPHQVRTIDLYKEGFNPVLVINKEKRRRDLHRDHETEAYRQMLEEADHLIFVYPVWWSGFPAILKGFIDRLFVSEFAYSYRDHPNGLLPKGLFAGKSAWCVYTMDAPAIVSLFDPGWRIMKRSILRYCGIHNVKRFFFSGVKRSSPEARHQWLNSLRGRASKLR